MSAAVEPETTAARLARLETALHDLWARRGQYAARPLVDAILAEVRALAGDACTLRIDDSQPRVTRQQIADPHAGVPYEARLIAAGAIDLRNNARFVDVGGGYVRVEPIDPTKTFAAAHADHGRGDEGGPDEWDCGCRGTDEQAVCAAAGCGFCRAALDAARGAAHA